MPTDVIDRLELTPVKLPVMCEIEHPGKEIETLVFLEEGVASMTTTFQDGSQVEVALAGYESILGASALLGTRRSLNRVYMQIAGGGYRCSVASAMQEFRQHAEFHRLVLRYVQAQFIQSAQTAGCNARHTVQQRLARWLLLCHERVPQGTIVLSQEFIAEMLGAQRTTVSVEASKLQRLGLIYYSRGRIDVLNKVKLEQTACECYRVVREHLTNYADHTDNAGESTFA
jgi:CRP-like cAMP-binding protein